MFVVLPFVVIALLVLGAVIPGVVLSTRRPGRLFGRYVGKDNVFIGRLCGRIESPIKCLQTPFVIITSYWKPNTKHGGSVLIV